MTVEAPLCGLKKCRRHGQPMVLLEEGNLNGVEVRYYGCTGCDRTTRVELSDHEQGALL